MTSFSKPLSGRTNTPTGGWEPDVCLEGHSYLDAGQLFCLFFVFINPLSFIYVGLLPISPFAGLGRKS